MRYSPARRLIIVLAHSLIIGSSASSFQEDAGKDLLEGKKEADWKVGGGIGRNALQSRERWSSPLLFSTNFGVMMKKKIPGPLCYLERI